MRRKLMICSVVLIFLNFSAAFSQEETEEKAVVWIASAVMGNVEVV